MRQRLPSGSVGRLSGLPGETVSDAQLAKDALPLAVMLVQMRSKCTLEPMTIVDTKLTSIPDTEGWRESWIFSGCASQRYVVPITFTRQGAKGTSFRVKADEVRLMNDATP